MISIATTPAEESPLATIANSSASVPTAEPTPGPNASEMGQTPPTTHASMPGFWNADAVEHADPCRCKSRDRTAGPRFATHGLGHRSAVIAGRAEAGPLPDRANSARGRDQGTTKPQRSENDRSVHHRWYSWRVRTRSTRSIPPLRLRATARPPAPS